MNTTVDENKQKELKDFLELKSAEPNPGSKLIQALHKTQEIFGYLPRTAMDEISDCLNVPTSKVWSAATFYHYFSIKPRGKYIVSVCLGTACYVKGARKVLGRVKKELKIDVNETTKDFMFTLDNKFCLGTCGISPVMMINGKVYGELTADKAAGIIKDIIKKEKIMGKKK